jgi:hypothetical protein
MTLEMTSEKKTRVDEKTENMLIYEDKYEWFTTFPDDDDQVDFGLRDGVLYMWWKDKLYLAAIRSNVNTVFGVRTTPHPRETGILELYAARWCPGMTEEKDLYHKFQVCTWDDFKSITDGTLKKAKFSEMMKTYELRITWSWAMADLCQKYYNEIAKRDGKELFTDKINFDGSHEKFFQHMALFPTYKPIHRELAEKLINWGICFDWGIY